MPDGDCQCCKKKLSSQIVTALFCNTFLIVLTIFSPFSLICSSVHSKLIEVEIQRLMIASLAAKSLLACCVTRSFNSGLSEFNVTAVSYTHLDVYKRQIFDTPNSTEMLLSFKMSMSLTLSYPKGLVCNTVYLPIGRYGK